MILKITPTNQQEINVEIPDYSYETAAAVKQQLVIAFNQQPAIYPQETLTLFNESSWRVIDDDDLVVISHQAAEPVAPAAPPALVIEPAGILEEVQAMKALKEEILAEKQQYRELYAALEAQMLTLQQKEQEIQVKQATFDSYKDKIVALRATLNNLLED